MTYGFFSGVSLNRWIQQQVYDMGEIPGAKRWVGNHNKLIKWNFIAYGTYCIDIVDCEMIVIYVKKSVIQEMWIITIMVTQWWWLYHLYGFGNSDEYITYMVMWRKSRQGLSRFEIIRCLILFDKLLHVLIALCLVLHLLSMRLIQIAICVFRSAVRGFSPPVVPQSSHSI